MHCMHELDVVHGWRKYPVRLGLSVSRTRLSQSGSGQSEALFLLSLSLIQSQHCPRNALWDLSVHFLVDGPHSGLISSLTTFLVLSFFSPLSSLLLDPSGFSLVCASCLVVQTWRRGVELLLACCYTAPYPVMDLPLLVLDCGSLEHMSGLQCSLALEDVSNWMVE